MTFYPPSRPFVETQRSLLLAYFYWIIIAATSYNMWISRALTDSFLLQSFNPRVGSRRAQKVNDTSTYFTQWYVSLGCWWVIVAWRSFWKASRRIDTAAWSRSAEVQKNDEQLFEPRVYRKQRVYHPQHADHQYGFKAKQNICISEVTCWTYPAL